MAHRHHPSLRWHHRLAHSLKWRLVALFLALALGTTLLFVAGTREAFSTGWRELVRPLLTDYVDRLAREIGSPPDLARAQALAQRLPVAIRIDGPQVNWRSEPERPRGGWRDGASEAAGDGARDGPRDGPRDPALRAMLTRQTADGHRLQFGIATWRGDDHPGAWGWWPLAGLLALTAAAFAYVRRLFKPLDDIRSGAERYGVGNFQQPIPLRRHDELGELATQVNQMAGNLQRMLEGQRGLLLAISHELRSPLTRARLNAELVADGPERDALLRDLSQMRDLISDLLESERLAAGHAALQRGLTDLNALVREQVADRQALATAPLPVACDLDADLPPLWLDAVRMRLLVRNLLGNALQHGQGSAVQVSTRCTAGGVQLVVRDHGPGVPPEQLGRLAEPFHRPEAARTRAGGGVGLGLYLCRLVAQGHGGTLALRNAQPGLEASVRLPLPPAGPAVA